MQRVTHMHMTLHTSACACNCMKMRTKHFALHLILRVIPSVARRLLRAVTSPSTHRRELREDLHLYTPALSTQSPMLPPIPG